MGYNEYMYDEDYIHDKEAAEAEQEAEQEAMMAAEGEAEAERLNKDED